MKSALNSEYKVVITHDAKAQLTQILRYLKQELGNDQAAQSMKSDMKDTKQRLSRIAGSLKLCDDAKLRSLGYRTIHFKHHRYFMLYRIEDSIVYVDAVYHDLQDFENLSR
ncbi:MAG: type II toxin-antitoxin system RelE/ParE family toxin [Eubacterium sp.]|nr:type II toxin-antitoxin system RelE/ParE family toxin [Eubacterium sp.]